LEQSKLYLQQGKSFSEIAERLNYADQSAFGRAFKRWTGITPKQFLKSL
jgi:AraC-like DNA-binding protein